MLVAVKWMLHLIVTRVLFRPHPTDVQSIRTVSLESNDAALQHSLCSK